jgi:hypothetical protein
MADNSSPESYGPLILHLSDAADGAHTYASIIGLLHNTEINIRANHDALAGTPAGPGGVPPAVPGLKALWNAAQEKQVTLTAAFNAACIAGVHLCRTCIHALMPVLGEHWNTSWTSAGFSGSLAVPDVPLTMLQQLRAYYTTNPTRETADLQGVACTAAACDVAVKAITAAETASNQGDTDAGIASANFKAGIAAGRARLTGLRTELEQLIEDDDVRWYAFGFQRPCDITTPGVPTKVVVTAGAPGSHTLMVSWNIPRRADNCRVIVTLKSDGSAVTDQIASDDQLTLTLDTVSSGTVVVLAVTARNSTGESPASDPVEIAVP